jgi:hypothetical protein|tara:strand:+ start:104 stop:265 length:162 start_codon:yes stop_codon:yes gene_type:complete
MALWFAGKLEKGDGGDEVPEVNGTRVARTVNQVAGSPGKGVGSSARDLSHAFF